MFSPSSDGFESPLHFIYRSEVDLHLRSLCQIYGVSADSLGTHTHTYTCVCVLAAVTYLSAVCSDSSSLAATFPIMPQDWTWPAVLSGHL